MTTQLSQLILVLFALPTIVSAAAPVSPIQAPEIVSKVEADFYRGPRPSYEELVALKGLGVKTIVDIENNKAAVKSEKEMAAKLGLKIISVPLSGFWRPTDKNIGLILSALSDRSLRPVYLHCEHGHDRTGLLVGLYRVQFDGWPAEKAYEEMLGLGFHRSLIFLDHYFREHARNFTELSFSPNL